MERSTPPETGRARQLYHLWLQQWLSGEWRPGEPIPSQRELVTRYGASRGSVREALQYLEQAGLVEISHGRQSRCRNPLQDYWQAPTLDSEDLQGQLQVLEMRALLEGEAAWYAAQRATDAELQRLDQEYGALRARQQGASTLAKAKADLTYHTLIAQISHHWLVIAFSQLFYARYFQVIHAALSRTLQRHGRYPDGIARQHGRIHRAIMTRDAETARHTAVEHILYTRSLLEN